MSDNSGSNPTSEKQRPWLEAHYAARRQRTQTLVKAAVDQLVQANQPVTIEAICRLSRELDPEGKGVQKSGVLQNPEAHAYYRQHSATYRVYHGRQERRPTRPPSEAQPPRVDPTRDVDRVRRRYRLLSKADLVERLLTVEQAYAEAHQQLAALQFELAEARRELQEAVLLPAQPSRGRRRPN
jgi:hypothetical protein